MFSLFNYNRNFTIVDTEGDTSRQPKLGVVNEELGEDPTCGLLHGMPLCVASSFPVCRGDHTVFVRGLELLDSVAHMAWGCKTPSLRGRRKESSYVEKRDK